MPGLSVADSKLDKIDAQNRGELNQPTLVVCEGKRDASFILHLAESRGIDGIQIGFPDLYTSNTYGKDGLREFLRNLRVRVGFKDLRHLVILRDRNGSAEVAFKEVIRQIADAGQYSVPTALEHEASGIPPITVRLIPDSDTEGNLDVLLLGAIEADYAPNRCFDGYRQCCGIGSLAVGKLAKIRLTTIVAASCHKNPSCSLAFVWNEGGNPISLNSKTFDSISDFLRQFSQRSLGPESCA